MDSDQREQAERYLGVVVNMLPHIQREERIPFERRADFEVLLEGMSVEDRIRGAASAAGFGLRRAADLRGLPLPAAAMVLGGAFGALMARDALSCGADTYVSAHEAAVRMARGERGEGVSLDESLALVVAVVFDLGLIWKVPPSEAGGRLALEIARAV